jgi:hypothetical protein
MHYIEESIKNVLNGTNYYSPLLQSYLQDVDICEYIYGIK